MGSVRSALLFGLVLNLVFGFEVYVRIRGFHSLFSEEGRDLNIIRYKFGGMDAMCEGSEWFVTCDEEIESAKQSLMELNQLTKEFQQEAEKASDLSYKLALLQKEHLSLVNMMDSLQQKLKAEKAKCVPGSKS